MPKGPDAVVTPLEYAPPSRSRAGGLENRRVRAALRVARRPLLVVAVTLLVNGAAIASGLHPPESLWVGTVIFGLCVPLGGDEQGEPS